MSTNYIEYQHTQNKIDLMNSCNTVYPNKDYLIPLARFPIIKDLFLQQYDSIQVPPETTNDKAISKVKTKTGQLTKTVIYSSIVLLSLIHFAWVFTALYDIFLTSDMLQNSVDNIQNNFDLANLTFSHA